MIPMRTLALILLLTTIAAAEPFVIEVVDDQTGRGVPLVELRTVNDIVCVTDSAGIVAFDEPGLMNQKIWFGVTSFGYEFPADGFGSRGTALDIKSGGSAKLKIKRINIAERLYRTTGGGIYRDTVLAGRKAPIKEPLLNAQVAGSDSVQSCIYRDRIYFFWGDTGKMSYPLGNFSTTGATAELPGKGGLDPAVGIDLNYFKDKNGFTKQMIPSPKEGAKWVSGFMVIPDESGRERMVAHCTIVKSLGKRLGQQLIAWNDEKEEFEPIKQLDKDTKIAPTGHAFPVTIDGQKYFYFPRPYPNLRVKADWKSVTDPSTYETFGADGVFKWKKGGPPPLGAKELAEQIKSGKIKREDCPFRLEDAETKKPILLHGASVAWNDYRKKWIMIAEEGFGVSFLGELYYAEAPAPEGPWITARKIVTHHREQNGKPYNMDFYNPMHHTLFDQDGGRIIYFEGTYTNMFSGNPYPTPRYEYNNVMYRLDLSDPRLKLD